MYTETQYNNSLYHFGIKGMHWGVRRYQNEDGTLTEAGKKKYYNNINSVFKLDRANDLALTDYLLKKHDGKTHTKQYDSKLRKDRHDDTISNLQNFYKNTSRAKNIGKGVTLTALGGLGTMVGINTIMSSKLTSLGSGLVGMGLVTIGSVASYNGGEYLGLEVHRNKYPKVNTYGKKTLLT